VSRIFATISLRVRDGPPLVVVPLKTVHNATVEVKFEVRCQLCLECEATHDEACCPRCGSAVSIFFVESRPAPGTLTPLSKG
jgi:hypothetical protein